MFDLDRFRSRDHAYFDEIMTQYGPMVWGVVRSFSVDEDHAEDLFQKTWVRAYKSSPRFMGSGSIGGWLHRIAVNVGSNDYRSRKRRQERRALLAQSHDGPADTASPLEEVVAGDRRRALHEALSKLPDRQRETVVLRVVQGLSSAEISERLNTSPATVRSNLRHALNQLRAVMEDDHEPMS